MSKRILVRLLCVAALSLGSLVSGAQSGTFSAYTPYSTFGMGDINLPGSAYNKSMGGVGIAARNRKFINALNPAAVSARDSLSVMADLSLFYTYKLLQQGANYNVNHLFNLGNIAVSLPVYRSLTAVVGITPFSSMGYKYSTMEEREDIIGKVGNISYSNVGQGSLYQVYAGLAATFWDKFSIGAQYLFYFGSSEKTYTQTFLQQSYRGLLDSYETYMTASSAKFGLQFEQNIGKDFSFCIGGTYRLKTNLNGNMERRLYAMDSSSGSVDSDEYSLSELSPRINIASEIGAGLSLNFLDKWKFEFDYTMSDWTGSALDKTPGFAVRTLEGKEFTNTVMQSFRFGMEWTPNRNDVRYYFKRASYRLGAYYNNEYYKIDGTGIVSYGITLGTTLPIFRWSNGLTVAADLGRRGSLKDNLVLERYASISLGFNLYDIWFRKPKYE
ncbi:MAG: hypothetical protein MJY61_00305 [Bacteroidales bacterium]|nr:hypothetical protein [Bacteroidales bacterium]